MDFSKCSLKIFKPQSPSHLDASFDAFYDFWRPLWEKNHQDWGMPGYFSSDSLTRQSEVLALSFEGRYIASVSHRYVNLSRTSTLQDSFFNIWARESIEYFSETGLVGAIGSQITVHPGFRKGSSGFLTKLFITFLSFYHLMHKDLDSIAGMVRSDKGIENLFIQCGAETLQSNVIYYSVPVNIVVFRPKKRAIKIPENYLETVQTIYRTKDFYEAKSTSIYLKAR